MLEAQGRQQSASQLAPSLAGRFEFAPDLILRSSLGAGLKAPKLEEISGLTVRGAGFNSPLEADRGGNATLQAERNLNWELALDKHLPNEAGTLGANIYVRRTEDFIERRTQLEGARWVERPYNEGTARHWGLELDAKLKTDALGWKGAALRSHLTLHGRNRTDIAGETAGRQKRRELLDLYLSRRLTPQLNLRLDAQNLLRADTRRLSTYAAGSDDWRLASNERGQRTLLLSLEGKW